MPFEPRTRLYVETALQAGATVELSSGQSHYLTHVMRARAGRVVALFNGRDGEWAAELSHIGKKTAFLRVIEQLRPQTITADIWLFFAPIKHGRIDYLVEKATELGASVLQPVITRRTIVTKPNLDRLRAHAIEAAEQSERLDVPELRTVLSLGDMLGGWTPPRRIFFGDETGRGDLAIDALRKTPVSTPIALLIGPEGGFAPEELEALRNFPHATPIGLGPRVLRADTAALAALTCVQAVRGDWVKLHPLPAIQV